MPTRRNLHAKFCQRLVECARAIPIVRPLDPEQSEATGALGPLVAKRQLDKVSRLVHEAVADGARNGPTFKKFMDSVGGAAMARLYSEQAMLLKAFELKGDLRYKDVDNRVELEIRAPHAIDAMSCLTGLCPHRSTWTFRVPRTPIRRRPSSKILCVLLVSGSVRFA